MQSTLRCRRQWFQLQRRCRRIAHASTLESGLDGRRGARRVGGAGRVVRLAPLCTGHRADVPVPQLAAVDPLTPQVHALVRPRSIRAVAPIHPGTFGQRRGLALRGSAVAEVPRRAAERRSRGQSQRAALRVAQRSAEAPQAAASTDGDRGQRDGSPRRTTADPFHPCRPRSRRVPCDGRCCQLSRGSARRRRASAAARPFALFLSIRAAPAGRRRRPPPTPTATDRVPDLSPSQTPWT